MSERERLVMLQSMLISGFAGVASLTYLLFPYWFPDQTWAALFCTFFWQASQVSRC